MCLSNLTAQDKKGTGLDTTGQKKPVFEKHQVYVDYRFGVVGNVTDTRTSSYFDQYWHLSFGATLYIRNFMLSYSINPSTVSGIKKEFMANNGYELKPYHKGFWGGGKGYWLNIVKHNFELAYEVKLNEHYSLVPGIGFIINRFTILNDSLHSYRYHLTDTYGLNAGCTLRRNFTIGRNAQTFVGISAYVNAYDLRQHFGQLGDSFYSFFIQCGIKFYPTGQVIGALLGGLTKVRP